MPKVLCKLRNASELINGVAFTQDVDGMVSEDISQELAVQFAKIPGYEIIGESDSKPGSIEPPADDLMGNLEPVSGDQVDPPVDAKDVPPKPTKAK